MVDLANILNQFLPFVELPYVIDPGRGFAVFMNRNSTTFNEYELLLVQKKIVSLQYEYAFDNVNMQKSFFML